MDIENKNKPAFPEIKTEKKSGVNDWGNTFSVGGLTKREYFAAMAMQGLCAAQNKEKYLVNDGFIHYPSLIIDAVGLADELLKQLNPSNQK